MSNLDAVAGMYNIVEEQRETADHRVPVEKFIEMLKDRSLPEEIAVAGLEEVLTGDEELRERLVSAMRDQMDYLNNQHPLPKIQFEVDGQFQGAGNTYEVEIDGEFHSLEPVFGRQIKEREDGWLVTPFRV